MKKVLWILVAVALIGWILYSNIQEQETRNTDKRTVYAILPLSGAVADFGQKIKSYMTLYMENTKDVPFEIVYLDDESKPDKAVSVFQQVARSHQKPVVISAFSFISRILIPMVQKEDGFTFALTTIEGDKLGLSTGFQRIAGGVNDETNKLLQYSKQFNTISIVNMEDDFGIAEKDLFVKSFQAEGKQIKNIIGLPLRSFDVRTEIQKILDNPPDAVFLSGTVTLAYMNAIKILKQGGYNGKIIANLAFSNPYTYKDLGEASNDIIALTVPSDVDNSLVKENKLLNLLQAQGVPPYFLPIQVFDTLDLIKYTIDNNLPFNQKTYTDIGVWKGVSGDVKLENGESYYPYVVVKLKDGKFVPVESEVK